MAKPIKSTDPRKPKIVAALKAASGASKVTNVTESENTYSGDCLEHKGGGRGRAYEHLGRYSIVKSDVK